MKAFTKEIYSNGGYLVPERIYSLLNPINNVIFYVGRTRKPLSDRLWGHIAAAKGKGDKFTNSIKDEYILNILASNSKPVIEAILFIADVYMGINFLRTCSWFMVIYLSCLIVWWG